MKSSLRHTLNQFDTQNKKLAAIASGGGPLEKLTKMHLSVDYVSRLAAEIHVKSAQSLYPLIRSQLSANYAASGIGTFSKKYHQTGELYSAAVTNAEIRVSLKGISIGFGRGFPKSIYSRGGALQYGAVHGGGGSRRRPKQKRTAAYVYSQTGQKKVAGVHYYPPHPFFELTDAQIDVVEQLYSKYFQQETDKVVARVSGYQAGKK